MNNYMPKIGQPTRNGQVSRNRQHTKLNQHDIHSLNRLITRSEIESIILKTPCKQKPRTRWLHWGILANLQRKTYISPSQTLPKGNTPKVIL